MSGKMFRLLTLTLLLALVMGALLPAVTAQDEVTLTLWIMPNGPDPSGAIEAEIAAFEEANPGIQVEYEILDWGSAWTRITNAAVSGEGPDVSQLGTTWVGAIDAFGALHHFSDEEIAAVGGPENFAAASWNTVIRADDDSGDVVALPWFVDTRAVIYREDIFDELGLDPAEVFDTWDSFVEGLQAIKDAGLTVTDANGDEVEFYPMAFPGKNDWNVVHNFAPWVWGAGGDMLTEDLSASAFNSEEAIAGVKFYASLYTQGFTPPDSLELNSAQIDGLFSEGRVAMVISGPWMVKNSRTPNDEGGWGDNEWAQYVGVAEIPAGPAGRYTFVGGSDLAVWNTSEHLEEAVMLAQFLVSDESELRYCDGIGMLPATNSALQSDAFAGDEDYGVFVTAIDHGRSYPAIAAWGPIETVMVTNLGALWDDVAGVNGPFDPDTMIPERLNAAAEEVNNVIAQSE